MTFTIKEKKKQIKENRKKGQLISWEKPEKHAIRSTIKGTQ